MLAKEQPTIAWNELASVFGVVVAAAEGYPNQYKDKSTIARNVTMVKPSIMQGVQLVQKKALVSAGRTNLF